MFEIATDIQIDAPPEAVWSVLTDGEKIDQWNPFIHRLEGALVRGEQLDIEVGCDPDGRMRFRPVVLRSVPARELRWKGKFLFSGLFDGEHVFELEETESGGTHFLHREKFSGLLAPLFRAKLNRETKPGFEAMNRALKERTEAGPEVLSS